MATNEDLIRRMAELTEAVKSGHEDPAVFDWERAKAEFEPQIKALVDAQVEEKLASQPVFKGVPVDAYEKAVLDGTLKNNRYTRMVKSISKQGYHTDFAGNKIKAVDFWLTHRLFSKGHGLMPDRIAPPSDDLKMALKALTSTGTGTGDELVPTDMVEQLWEDVHLTNVLVGSLDRIPMTSNPMDLPNALGDVTFRKGSENVATTASDPATAKNTLTVTEHLAEVDWSYSLEEDAIVALMPAVRMTIARNAGEYMDGFALNADATATSSNINTDSTPGADTYYLSGGQDGIRHQVITDNSAQLYNMNGALTDAGIIAALTLMGKYAVDPRQLLFSVDVNTYFKGFLDATTSNAPGTLIKSIADVGYSVVVTGQVASYRGVPIVIPVLAGKTQADGTISDTSANNTKGQVMIPNRTQWKVGFMRDMEIEVDRDIQKRQVIMVVSYRMAVGCRGTRSSATHTAGIRNITV